MIKLIYLLLPISAVAILSCSGCAVSAQWQRFTPMVVEENQSTSIIMEAKFSGMPSSVELALTNGTLVQLIDNGTNGDHVSGDEIYTATLTTSQVLHDFTPDDVNRNFIGFLRLYEGGNEIKKYNIFADILTSNIPPVQIMTMASDVQYSENLVNIVDSSFYNNFSIQSITQKFYSHFGDLYDYINVIYEFAHFRNRNHITIRNNVQGIGIAIMDNTNAYGSDGRLLGRTEFPVPTFFDGASPNYSHELGHQWINFVDVVPLNYAIPHWPLSDLASGIMGWGTGRGTQGLVFNFDLVPSGSDYQLIPNYESKTFSDLSLYLMGFLPPDQVQSYFVFDNQSQTPSSGGILLGPVTTVGTMSLT